MNSRSILEYFQNREKRILDDIRDIVEIESPSFNAERSSLVAGWIENKIREIPLDLDLETLAAPGTGEHVLIRLAAGDAPGSLLLGHTDTVHPLGTNLKNPIRIEAGKFYGPGIFDMKANIVLMLEMLRYFAAAGSRPSRPITILLSCDEEVGSTTGRPIVEREAIRSARCLVFEPSFNGMVKTGRKGTGMFKIETHGRPAHAGLEPENGASAILEISKQIEKIHDLNDLSAGTSANVCTISGGTTSNVIPDHAEASIDVRFKSMSEADRVESAIRSLKPFDERVSLEITGGVNRPPMERSKAVVDFFGKARDLAASFGYELGETEVGGASDGNFVAALGIPVLDGLGIAGDGAHTLHEHIIVSDVAKRATLVTLLMLAD